MKHLIHHIISQELHSKKVLSGIGVFFLLYTFLWMYVYDISFFPQSQQQREQRPVQKGGPIVYTFKPKTHVLSAQTETSTEQPTSSYTIPLAVRKQTFNLSCEFAAATSIIYHYTQDQFFAPSNEEKAEKALMTKVGVSQNPNIGIRMGKAVPGDDATLYNNLNEKFGGADYYGVHALPFLDVFGSYGLLAKPIKNDSQTVENIKKAIAANHLVMTWLRVGYSGAIDLPMSYGGSVPAIKGEHVVVITGYDVKGFFFMDPARGLTRYAAFTDVVEATKLFIIPYLEVYPAPSDFSPEEQIEPTMNIDEATGLDRSLLRFIVQNGTGKAGKGSEVASILRDFGYTITAIHNAEIATEGMTIYMKQDKSDYLRLLERDLHLANYHIASIAADLSPSALSDVIVTIGKD